MSRDIRDLERRVKQLEQAISKLPTRISSSVGGGGGSTNVYLAPSKAELPDASTVPEGSFGRVNASGDNGNMYVVNIAKTGWNSFTSCE